MPTGRIYYVCIKILFTGPRKFVLFNKIALGVFAQWKQHQPRAKPKAENVGVQASAISVSINTSH